MEIYENRIQSMRSMMNEVLEFVLQSAGSEPLIRSTCMMRSIKCWHGISH